MDSDTGGAALTSVCNAWTAPISATESPLVAESRTLSNAESRLSVMLFPALILVISCVARRLLRKSAIPETVILLLIGGLLGVVASCLFYIPHLSESISIWTRISPPELFLFTMLPPLLFEGAMRADWYYFRKSIIQILLLAFVLVPLHAIALGFILKYVLRVPWDINAAIMFGSLLSATDPVAVVALLKSSGAPIHLITVIEAESLLNDGSSFVFFEMFLRAMIDAASPTTALSPGENEFVPSNMGIVAFSLKLLSSLVVSSVGGLVMGLVFGVLTLMFIQLLYKDVEVEVGATFAIAYLVFYIAQGPMGYSGPIAVVVYGLFMSAVGVQHITPVVQESLFSFWQVIVFLCNSIAFMFSGVLCVLMIIDGWAVSYSIWDVAMIPVLFVILNILRALGVLVLSPIMRRTGYGLEWRHGLVVSYSGLRGAVTLVMALMAHYVLREAPIPFSLYLSVVPRISLWSSGLVFLSLVVNGTTISYLCTILGLSKTPRAQEVYLELSRSKLKLLSRDTIENIRKAKRFAQADIQALSLLFQVTLHQEFEVAQVMDRKTDGAPIQRIASKRLSFKMEVDTIPVEPTVPSSVGSSPLLYQILSGRTKPARGINDPTTSLLHGIGGPEPESEKDMAVSFAALAPSAGIPSVGPRGLSAWEKQGLKPSTTLLAFPKTKDKKNKNKNKKGKKGDKAKASKHQYGEDDGLNEVVVSGGNDSRGNSQNSGGELKDFVLGSQVYSYVAPKRMESELSLVTMFIETRRRVLLHVRRSVFVQYKNGLVSPQAMIILRAMINDGLNSLSSSLSLGESFVKKVGGFSRLQSILMNYFAKRRSTRWISRRLLLSLQYQYLDKSDAATSLWIALSITRRKKWLSGGILEEVEIQRNIIIAYLHDLEACYPSVLKVIHTRQAAQAVFRAQESFIDGLENNGVEERVIGCLRRELEELESNSMWLLPRLVMRNDIVIGSAKDVLSLYVSWYQAFESDKCSQAIESIARNGRDVFLQRGEKLVSAGEITKGVYILIRGSIISKTDFVFSETLLNRGGDGQLLHPSHGAASQTRQSLSEKSPLLSRTFEGRYDDSGEEGEDVDVEDEDEIEEPDYDKATHTIFNNADVFFPRGSAFGMNGIIEMAQAKTYIADSDSCHLYYIPFKYLRGLFEVSASAKLEFYKQVAQKVILVLIPGVADFDLEHELVAESDGDVDETSAENLEDTLIKVQNALGDTPAPEIVTSMDLDGKSVGGGGEGEGGEGGSLELVEPVKAELGLGIDMSEEDRERMQTAAELDEEWEENHGGNEKQAGGDSAGMSSSLISTSYVVKGVGTIAGTGRVVSTDEESTSAPKPTKPAKPAEPSISFAEADLIRADEEPSALAGFLDADEDDEGSKPVRTKTIAFGQEQSELSKSHLTSHGPSFEVLSEMRSSTLSEEYVVFGAALYKSLPASAELLFLSPNQLIRRSFVGVLLMGFMYKLDVSSWEQDEKMRRSGVDSVGAGGAGDHEVGNVGDEKEEESGGMTVIRAKSVYVSEVKLGAPLISRRSDSRLSDVLTSGTSNTATFGNALPSGALANAPSPPYIYSGIRSAPMVIRSTTLNWYQAGPNGLFAVLLPCAETSMP